jgi:hypothetical protein
MNRFLASRPLLSFFIVSISAGIITAWIVYPQTGPFGWIKNASNHQLILKGFVLSLILATGAAVTYIAGCRQSYLQTSKARVRSVTRM